ncbi:terminase small subunit [Methylobacterium aquaticum]|uniref:terminase small subunit n=1 Tax=Methylobacterium aquaticum TaxID=270351 RepID=UPI003D1754BA
MSLTDKQRRFVEEYLVDLNATQAAIRAGYSEDTAAAIGYENLRKPEIAAAVEQAQAIRAERTGITADRVLVELWRIATTDANELVEHRRGCCRYCHGADHRYQFTPREFERAEAAHAQERAEAIRKGREDIGDFDAQGGTGFNATLPAAPDCPECFGEGVERVRFRDSVMASTAARSLYAGVKVTKDGMEMKLHPKDKALELVGRHLGMWKDKVEHDVSDGLSDLMKAIDGRTRGLPGGG